MAAEALSSISTSPAGRPGRLPRAGHWRAPLSKRLRYDRVKNVIDRLGALVLLSCLAPFLLLVALVIVLDSPGSPIYRQWRRGRDHRPFHIFKFRTMELGAHAKRASLFPQNQVDGIIFKLKDDPRTTRIGRFLRRWSIDEFPQLLNVLRGEMSLIGPRPFSAEVFANPCDHPTYPLWLAERYRVLPGMTGLWQVSGRNNIPFEKLMRLDLLYVRLRGWRLDLYILRRTFWTVISRAGAF